MSPGLSPSSDPKVPGDVPQVSVRAGHSSVAFTLDRYGHLYEDRGDEAETLDALLATARARSAVRPLPR